jgi:hypothetical protein
MGKMTEAQQHNGRATWRELDKEGCAYGRHISDKFEKLEHDVEDSRTELKRGLERLDDRQNKLTWAIVGAAISVGTAALLLGLNLALGIL